MGVTANTIWEVRGTGNATNPGGFDPSFGGTDYSQQNAAQQSYTDIAIGSNAAQITSVARPFVSTDAGNTLKVPAGITGFTAGIYQIFSVAGGVATLDRAIGTANTTQASGTIKFGGASDTLSNIAASVVGGNIIFYKGTNAAESLIGLPPLPAGYITQPTTLVGYTTNRSVNNTDSLGFELKGTTGQVALTLNANCRVRNVLFSNRVRAFANCTAVLMQGTGSVVENCLFYGWSIGVKQTASNNHIYNCAGQFCTIPYLLYDATCSVNGTIGAGMSLTFAGTVITTPALLASVGNPVPHGFYLNGASASQCIAANGQGVGFGGMTGDNTLLQCLACFIQQIPVQAAPQFNVRYRWHVTRPYFQVKKFAAPTASIAGIRRRMVYPRTYRVAHPQTVNTQSYSSINALGSLGFSFRHYHQSYSSTRVIRRPLTFGALTVTRPKLVAYSVRYHRVRSALVPAGAYGHGFVVNDRATLINCLSVSNQGFGFLQKDQSFHAANRLLNCADFGSNPGLDTTGLTANNTTGFATLAAQPLVNPGGGNFGLNSVVGGGQACRGAGYPSSFSGPTTSIGGLNFGFPNTLSFFDIGAAQHVDAAVPAKPPLPRPGPKTTWIVRTRTALLPAPGIPITVRAPGRPYTRYYPSPHARVQLASTTFQPVPAPTVFRRYIQTRWQTRFVLTDLTIKNTPFPVATRPREWRWRYAREIRTVLPSTQTIMLPVRLPPRQVARSYYPQIRARQSYLPVQISPITLRLPPRQRALTYYPQQRARLAISPAASVPVPIRIPPRQYFRNWARTRTVFVASLTTVVIPKQQRSCFYRVTQRNVAKFLPLPVAPPVVISAPPMRRYYRQDRIKPIRTFAALPAQPTAPVSKTVHRVVRQFYPWRQRVVLHFRDQITVPVRVPQVRHVTRVYSRAAFRAAVLPPNPSVVATVQRRSFRSYYPQVRTRVVPIQIILPLVRNQLRAYWARYHPPARSRLLTSLNQSVIVRHPIAVR